MICPTRSLLVAVLAAASVSANIFVTSPLSATVWQANDGSAITWQDSGSPPLDTTIGPVQIFLAVGAATAQQKLVQLGQADAADGTFNVPWPLIESMDIGDSPCFGVQFVPLNPASGAGMSFSPQFTISGLTGQFNASLASVVSSLAPQCISNAAAAVSSIPASSSALPSSTALSSSLPPTSTKNTSASSTSTAKPTGTANSTKSAAMSLKPIHIAGLDMVLLFSAVVSMLALAI